MNKEVLRRGLDALNIGADEDMLRKFETYSKLLIDRNKKINLTAITDDTEISTKHFLDSILPLTAADIPLGAAVIDVGTGAGFPGIPIKIVRGDISLTLLDSLLKRINFLGEVCREIGLSDVECVHARAEDEARHRREKYDAAVSRAVAPLKILAEYCLPYVKVGGIFLALKSAGAEIEREIADAKPIIGTLGGKVEDEARLLLPETDITRSIIVIRKTAATPAQFPRSSARIKKGK